MDTRKKMKNRKLKEQERSKRKEGLKGGKALYKRKDRLIGSNDIIVSPFANKVKLEDGENSNPVKAEVREEEEVKVEEDVKVVTVEEKVDLEEEPCVEQEGSVSTAVAGHVMEVTVPVAGPSSQSMEIRLGSTTAAPTTLEEKVNYFVGVVGNLTAELKAVKEKLSKVSPEVTPPTAPNTAGTSFRDRDPPNMEAPEEGVNHSDLAAESRLANEDGTGSTHCLVCYKDVPSSNHVLRDDGPLIDKQMEGIFVLKNLLCIPSTSLAKFLEIHPDENPGAWINLCGECGQVVEKAWRIHDDIVSASKKLKGIQKQLINKIKGSTMGPRESSVPLSDSDIGTVVTRESRKFVREHDYGHLLDPFQHGDREACRFREERRKNEVNASTAKRTQQIDGSEADGLTRKIRVTKSKNLICRTKKSQTKSIAKLSKVHFPVRMEEIHEKNFKYRDNSRKRRQKVQRKCPHCDLVTDKYNLAFHIKRVHEKAFQVTCEICGNRYNHPYALDRHKADNHGICSVWGCREEFPGDRLGLRNHQLEAHGREINVFGCEDCGKLFPQANNLRIHQRKVHGPHK